MKFELSSAYAIDAPECGWYGTAADPLFPGLLFNGVLKNHLTLEVEHEITEEKHQDALQFVRMLPLHTYTELPDYWEIPYAVWGPLRKEGYRDYIGTVFFPVPIIEKLTGGYSCEFFIK